MSKSSSNSVVTGADVTIESSDQGTLVVCLTASGPIEVTLPARPAPDQELIIKNATGDNPVTINNNGLGIDGVVGSVALAGAGQAATLRNIRTVSGGTETNAWWIVSDALVPAA